MPLLRTAVVACVLLSLVGGCKKRKGGEGATDAGHAAQHDGPMGYRLTPGHTGAVDGTLQAPLRRRWVAHFDNAISYPIVTHLGVYVIEAASPPVVRGYNVDTAETLWPAVPIDGGETQTTGGWLAYEDGRLFALNDRGLVTAIDAESGSTLWTTSVKENQGATQFHWALTVADGVVYVPGRGLAGNVSAMDADSGFFRWTTTQGDNQAAIAVGSNQFFTAFGCASTTAFQDESGSKTWENKETCAAAGYAFAAVDQDVIYAGMAAGDSSTGFRYDKSGNSVGGFASRAAIAVHDNHYVTVAAPELHSMKRFPIDDSGWTDTDADDVVGAPIIVNGQVISVASDGTIKMVKEDTGELLWNDNVGASTSLLPTGPVWGDLGTNGEVLAVPAQKTLFVYESNPDPPPTPDEGYKTYCTTNNAAFYIVGDDSRLTSGGDSLGDGALLFEGTEALESNSSLTVSASTNLNPTDFQNITVETHDETKARFSITFATRLATNPLMRKYYPTANLRSSYSDLTLGNASLAVQRLNSPTNVNCADGNGRFELTELSANGDGIQSIKGHFLFHCNREAASVRGCFAWHK